MRRAADSRVSITSDVVLAVAEYTDREPTSLRPLEETIDTDALDALFSTPPGNGIESLTFVYEGCRISIDRGAVTVEDAP